MIKSVSGIGIAICGLACAACDPYLGERPEVFYVDRAEVTTEGAFDRGWLPLWLPDSAIEITERHDVDTNNRAFSYKLAEPEELNLADCVGVEKADRVYIRPSSLPKDIEKSQGILSCQTFFLVERDDTYFVWLNR